MPERDFIAELLTATAAFVRESRLRRPAGSSQTKTHPADLLTETDLAAQRRITDAIAAAYPADAIMAEEDAPGSRTIDPAGRCWVCDPIDGTHNFVRSLFGTYAIALALVEDARVIAAGVALPELGSPLLAERGGGAMRDGKSIRVSNITDINAAKVEIDFQRPTMRARILGATDGVLRGAGQVRSHGSAVVGLVSVATGDAEAYLHTHLKPWDCAAAALLIEEAGGRVTRFDGSPMGYFASTCDIVATNGAMHDTILDLVSIPAPLG